MYNKNMTKRGGARRASGFTIIEVMLSLAVSGLVLVGALIGVSSTIARQRYRDVIETTASLLRQQYEYVSRVQIQQRTDDEVCDSISGVIGTYNDGSNMIGRGRSKCSVYGVVVTLGLDGGKRMQTANLIGTEYNAYRNSLIAAGKDPDEEIKTMNDLQLFHALHLTDVYNKDNSTCTVTNLLNDETYRWDASIETTEKDVPARVTLLIVRSPRTGAIHTYVMDYSGRASAYEPFDYTAIAPGLCSNTQGGVLKATVKDGLSNSQNNSGAINSFQANKEVKLCIKSEDALATFGKRRMIRIVADGHNSSAVELVDMDSDGIRGGNECQ